MSLLKDVIAYGTHAARPAAGREGRLYYDTDTSTIFRDNGASWDALTVSGGGGSSFDYVCAQEQQASGTHGGTFTSGAWQTRTLNIITADSAAIASLASSQLTVPAGTYRCHASAIGVLVDEHKSRLQDVTGATTLLVGSSEYANSGSGASSSLVSGRFTLAVSSALELQHRCAVTRGTNGFGDASGFGVVEVYSQLELWKE